MKNRIYDIVGVTPEADSLWQGEHKIPWNDPAFSARILAEHLSQEHHLASRKRTFIEAQASWIRSRFLNSGPAAILDLGCGPGLYSRLLADQRHQYLGIDFSPASIEYATQEYGTSDQCVFRLGNVVETDFGGPFDVIMMVYGELNVFAPSQCRQILAKAHAALALGGTLLIEHQCLHAVKGVGEAPNSWTRAESGGLFADEPYVCLTENHWFEEEAVALQCFHVLTSGQDKPVSYRSTTKAWSDEEMTALLIESGFSEVRHHRDWPVPDDGLALVSAVKE
ncbi:methyltransferase domain-containing protein [Pseudodesulfovibrio sediminis]|uniref:Methyltransferase domain-containing protein n=1 Tax=Pseudodesulfovibrio sediminis TaxID=2810563 RepID=A0ABM8I3E9_9BACT|nr:methyltransferase domain-containing protein [Pseudodesulfovibrio sediminis]BCS89653.1 hypothetical protein PSDVSF_28950 [Pseudodesulfovibrio sediminis]